MLNSQEGCISLPLWKRYSKGRTWKWSRNKSSSLASQVPMSKISISAPHMSTNIYCLFFVLKDKKKSWHCQHSLLQALLITGEIQRVYLKAVCFVLSYMRHVDHDLICSKFCKSKQTNKPLQNAMQLNLYTKLSVLSFLTTLLCIFLFRLSWLQRLGVLLSFFCLFLSSSIYFYLLPSWIPNFSVTQLFPSSFWTIYLHFILLLSSSLPSLGQKDHKN